MIRMNMSDIEKSLNKMFSEPLKDEEIRSIIFWTDYDKEFVDDYYKLNLGAVKIIELTENNQFFVKHLLEEEDLKSSYLIYTHLDLGSSRNWLYDTYKYSKTFYADRLSIMMKELEIGHNLRSTVEKYATFFNNKERYRRFKALNIHTYTAEKIELGMMNVLCKTHSIDFEPVLRTVLIDTLDENTNHYLSEMDKYFSLETFWNYIKHVYDYDRKKKTLKTLFIHLTMTAVIQSINEEHLSNYNQFIAERNQTNAHVFIDHWMHHKTDFSTYNDYIVNIENEIKLSDVINNLPVDVFQEADVFPYFDRAIIIYIANHLMDQQEDFAEYINLIHLRRTKHFYSEYRPIYEALYNTVKMHEFKKKYTHGIPKGEAFSIYRSYIKDYYVMDSYYREFYVAFDENNEHEIMYKLKRLVEHLYTGWFMGELSTHWSHAMKSEMTDDWSLPGVGKQQQFYSSHVAPHIRQDERAFVIISDALRFEAGKELQEQIQSKIIGDCDLQTMLGVVPSVTKLGMAALLPHRELTIENTGQVLVNGESTSGIENRRKILAEANEQSLALHYEDLLSMNITKQREVFKGKKLIYIYHDTIDAIGDNATTEVQTFNAVKQAIEQLSELVRSLTNNLSATNIYVTADHGFLYERDKLAVSDLMTKESLDAIEMKRRYILSHEKKDVQGQLAIDLSNVIDNNDPLYAYVPNATIRYRIQGAGANFVHGGASLQEVVIPLLTIKNKRKGQSGANIIEKVDVILTSTMRRITNSIFSLEFFQTERVADNRTSRSVAVYIQDESEQVLSNEESIIADLITENPKERIFKIQFALKNIAYDRSKPYYLIVKDTETDHIIERVPFTINLGIISDFDF